MVTVIDAVNFLNDYKEAESLQDRGESLGPQDRRSVSNLLIDQIEFCDVLVINKIDLLEQQSDKLTLLKEILHKLNPRARIIPATKGNIPLKTILNTGLFSFEQAQQAPGWLKEIRGEHIPETEEYGISSMSFRADRPFHPERYWKFLNKDWMSGIFRSKGMFWLATRMDTGGSWSQAGGQVNIGCAGTWMARHFKPDKDGIINLPPGFPPDVVKMLEKPYGDRRQELVFIGLRLDKSKMEQALKSCLLTGDEFALGPEQWKTWSDPFPQWIASSPQDAGEEVTEMNK